MGVNLDEHIEGLRRWLDEKLGVPAIDEVLVVELSRAEIGAAHLTLSRDRVKTPEAFAARWDELMSRGYPWINVSCYGLHGRTMIVGIELPQGPTGATQTSVVFSGPNLEPKTRKPREDGYDRITIVE